MRLLRVFAACAVIIVLMSTKAPSASAAFPPTNGRVIWAFPSSGSSGPPTLDLFSARPDGSDRRQLTSGSYVEEAVASPRGDQVAFIDEAPFGGQRTVSIVDIATGSSEVLSSSYSTLFSYLAWSADGDLYVNRQDPPILDLVRIPIANELWEVRQLQAPVLAFSPVAYRVAAAVDSVSSSVVITDIGGTNPVDLGPQYGTPAWSPDGSRLAFGNTSDSSVVIANADGSGSYSVQLPNTGRTWWSPDGSELVNSTGDAIHPDGTPAIGPTAPPPAPGYSANGARLVDWATTAVCDEPIVHRGDLWFVRSTCTTGVADRVFGFGIPGDQPLMGDWRGFGRIEPGVYRAGRFYIEGVYPFGDPGDVPVTGDWNGDGPDSIGVFRRGTWFLTNDDWSGVAEMTVGFGDPGDVPVVGDWDGDGVDTIGVFRSGVWYLTNDNNSGIATIVVPFGQPGDRPVVGDWTQSGRQNIGVVRNGVWYLADTIHAGVADRQFTFGSPGDEPVVFQPTSLAVP